jgi:hypothetical protein
MTKDLQARLARSLDLANARDAKAHRQAPAPAPVPAERRCKKISVSLFESDLKRLHDVSEVMIQNDFYPSPSLIIKLALRTAPLTDMALMRETFHRIQAEDGRKW